MNPRPFRTSFPAGPLPVLLILVISLNSNLWGAPPTLPALTLGPDKGKHAVYECSAYRAEMDVQGRLWIQVLKKGQPVGKRFPWAHINCNYHIPKTLSYPSRPIISFTDPPAAALQPPTIHLRGMLQDGVPFQVEYTFRDDAILVSGSCDDPRDLQYPSSFHLASNFPANWSIAPAVPQTEREKLLAGCFLLLKERRDGKTVKSENPYWDVMRFRGELVELAIKGVFSEHILTIEPKSGGRLSGHIRAGFCPWSGFSLQFGCPNDTLRTREALSLSFD